jgi:prolyl oligopeptidase
MQGFVLMLLTAIIAQSWPARSPVNAAGPSRISSIVRTDTAIFYLERLPGTIDRRLMMRRGNHQPRVLLDPTIAFGSTGMHDVAMANLLPSLDGTHLALSLIPADAPAQASTRIVDTTSGHLLPDDLPRTPRGPMAWSLDGTTLFYGQRAAGTGPELAERAQIFAHRLGMTGADQTVFGAGVDPNVAFDMTDEPSLTIPSGSSYAIGVIAHRGRPDLTLYDAPIAAVLSGGQIPWQKIVDVDDAVTSFDVHDDRIYLLTHLNAPRCAVAAIDLTDPTASISGIVAQGADTVAQIAVAADALYVRSTQAGATRLRKLAWTSTDTPGPITDVPLPTATVVWSLATDARADGAIVALGSPQHSLEVDALDPRGQLTDTGIVGAIASPAADRSGIHG